MWGHGTTACASDSKKFGAWDQNLMTEWHARYGGRGVMIYWHIDRKSACIYSQLKRCSSSEVAAMIEGVLRHCTDMGLGSCKAGSRDLTAVDERDDNGRSGHGAGNMCLRIAKVQQVDIVGTPGR
jgi:hypothetical protein